MLEQIRLTNFKSLENVQLDPQRITVFIGPNGSGKSSIIQALMLLRQSLGSTQPVFGDPGNGRDWLVDLVGFEEVVHLGERGRQISIGFDATTTVVDEISHPPLEFTAAQCSYDVSFALRWGTPAVARIHGKVVTTSPPVVNVEAEWETDASMSPVEVSIVDSRGRFSVMPDANVGKPFHLGTWTATPEEFGPVKQNLMVRRVDRVLNAINTVIASWRFVPALRGFPQSAYSLREGASDELSLGRGYDEMASAVASDLAYNRQAVAKASAWIEKITRTSIATANRPGKKAAVMSDLNGREIPIVNEGFGTNQLAFLMYQLAVAPSGGMVGVEEPETHLHPYAVSKLGDILVEIARDRDLQLLLTTHSEHLLLSLLANVLEGKLAADDLAVYYFSGENGRTATRRLEITPDGMVKGGLPGFIDAALEAQRRRLNVLSHVS